MTSALEKRIEKMERARAPTEAEGDVHSSVRSALEFHASLKEQGLDVPPAEESEAEIEAFFDWLEKRGREQDRARIDGKPGKTD